MEPRKKIWEFEDLRSVTTENCDSLLLGTTSLGKCMTREEGALDIGGRDCVLHQIYYTESKNSDVIKSEYFRYLDTKRRSELEEVIESFHKSLRSVISEYIISRYNSGGFTIDTLELMMQDFPPQLMYPVLTSAIADAVHKNEDHSELLRILFMHCGDAEEYPNFTGMIPVITPELLTEISNEYTDNTEIPYLLGDAYKLGKDHLVRIVDCYNKAGVTTKSMLKNEEIDNWQIIHVLFSICTEDVSDLEELRKECMTHLTDV